MVLIYNQYQFITRLKGFSPLAPMVTFRLSLKALITKISKIAKIAIIVKTA